MLRLICKKLVKTYRNQSKIHSLQNPSLKSNSKSKNPSSLIQCLTDSYGFSQETALLTAEKIHFKNPKDPNKTLFFFKTIGFSKTQIRNIVAKRPQLLLSKPESTLLPKIQFFQQMGISNPELIELLVSHSAIFTYSLKKKIKPSFELFRTFCTDETVLKVLRNYCLCFNRNFEQTLVPNVGLLKNSGVPDHRISKLLMLQPTALLVKPDVFEDNLEIVTKSGFNPSTNMFLEAVRSVMSVDRSVWDAKFEVYRSFGWSDDEVMFAFRRHPSSLRISKEKIRKGLNFFMNELGWKKSILYTYPHLFLFSFEKRILRRYEVLQILFSKGLVKELNNARIFMMSEKMFLETFVVKHQVTVPEILTALQGGEDCTCEKCL